MTSVATLQPEPAPILACTISRDVQNFDLLIDDMELELGESWGDLSFEDALLFLEQPEAATLEFVAIAVDGEDESDLSSITEIIKAAKAQQHQGHPDRRPGQPDRPAPAAAAGGRGFRALSRCRKARCTMPSSACASPRPPRPRSMAVTRRDRQALRPRFKAKGDRNGVVLPVHGLAGGVGATTFAVNLAWELATIAKTDAPRVCLIDLDLQFGSVATYLDLPRKEAVFEMLSDTAGVDSDAFLSVDADLQRQAARLHRAGRHAAAGHRHRARMSAASSTWRRRTSTSSSSTCPRPSSAGPKPS